jgi:hypothetical protein
MKVEKVLELLQSKKVVTRKELNRMLDGGRNVTSLIQVLQRKGHVIETHYNDLQHPESYEYVEYIQPFYIVARSIQRNFPDLEHKIREEYRELSGETEVSRERELVSA